MMLLKKYIPTKTITVRPNDKPFMNNKIRNKIRQPNRIHYKAKTTNNPDHWKKFREIRNEVIDLVRKAKDEYKNKLTSELLNKDIPPGKWWRIAKSISNFTKARDPPPFLEHDGQICIHPSNKVEILNTHFSNIANIDNEPVISDNVTPLPCHLNEFIITEQEILDQLKILNVNKPAGPDGVSPRLLKDIAYSISKPLTKFFNMSLSIKQVPLLWKIAHVSPIFKGKGNPHSPQNYRPISVTSIVCKIMKKILFKHLFNYMKTNNILSKCQSGFQPNDSTVNQPIEIYHNIISNMDRGRDVRFVFCDVSKAFDKVWHKGLLFKLKLTGVNKQLISWIESYLSDRQQKVVSEGFSSTLKGIKAGVPQGSVLDPFLFLVYINDIVNDINNDIRLFADDTSLFVVVENDHAAAATSLTDDLNVISNWAKKNGQFNLILKKQKILYLVEGTGSTHLYILD